MVKQTIEFVDLKAQQRRIREPLNRAIGKVLDHGVYIMGPEVSELEKLLCSFAGAGHCISCASGTDALVLALMALNVRAGDAVFVPSFTFVATAEAAALLGATPVFVDVDPEYFVMEPASLESAIQAASGLGLRPKAIIPVDLFGQPADYDSLGEIAARRAIPIVADAAQSFGAHFKGRRVGTLASITTTSFFPAKPLGCYGDGGAVFTDDDALAGLVRSMRNHGGGQDKYDNVRIGINGRMDTLQAAILIEKLKIFPDELAARERIATRYVDDLSGFVSTPAVRVGTRCAWAQFTVRSRERDHLARALKARGIPTGIYYPRPLHLQQAYSGYPRASAGLAVSESLCREVLSLPMHPYLDAECQDRICAAIRQECPQAAVAS